MDGIFLFKLVPAILLAAGFSFGAQAQGGDDNPRSESEADLEALQSQFRSERSHVASSADVVDVPAGDSASRLWPGTMMETTVLLHVAEGWHINAHRPLQDFLIGTSLRLDVSAPFRVPAVRYPEPNLMEFGFAEEELAVYEGDVPVQVSVQALEEAAPGSYTLRGEIRVQACNDEVCLRPSDVPIEVPITVTTSGK